MAHLSTAEAKRFYDRFGAKQDQQDFYEAPAITYLLDHGDFAHASSLFELGCGTGRLARELLLNHLSATATYRGVDISSTMVALAEEKLAPFAPRTTVTPVPGDLPLPCPPQSVDRFLATYVFDLLPDQEIRRLLAEAHRILQPGGLLVLAGITPGTTLVSRLVMGIWSGLARLAPKLTGGCRPIRLGDYLDSTRWQVKEHDVVVAWGIASEVVIAERLESEV